MRGSYIRLIGLLLVLLSSSCSYDFSNIPEGAQIACGSNDDCPEGWTCVGAINRCVKAENLADQPVTSSESITVYGKDSGEVKEQAADGDIVRVRFDVVQELDLGITELKIESTVFENEDWSRDDNGYHYTFKMTAAADIGNGKHEIVINAVNTFGSTYRKVAGTVTLNFHKPDLAGDVSLVVDKPAMCPLTGFAITAVTTGTQVTVSFWATEELLNGKPANAVLKLDQGGSNREFSLPDPQVYDLFYIYKFTLPADIALEDGEYKLFLTLEDLAKNGNVIEGKKVGAGLTMKFSRPSAPGTEMPDNLVLKRKPWGTKDTGAVKAFTIEAGDEVADDSTMWVLAYDGPDISSALEIGQAPIRNRTFATSEADPRSMKLSSADRVEVYLAAYDIACNRSDLALVRYAEWTATMGHKVSGSIVENPHKFIGAGIMQDATVQDSYVTEPEVFNENGFIAVSQAGRQRWVNRTPSDLFPPTRSLHAIAYDSDRKRVVLFGGTGSGGNLDDTWEWDGANWMNRTPKNNITGMVEHAMAYDSSRNKTVLFGGQDDWGMTGWTYEWDGESWELVPSEGPSVAKGHALAYDSVRGRVVLFGGRDAVFENGYLDETWEWDGSEWTKKDPLSKPPGLSSHALAFDSARGQMVLFGGRDYSGNFYNSTWVWDGTNWAKKTPASSPPKRYWPGMAFDISRGRVVLFGGRDPAGSMLNDTWEWDGANWTQKIPSSSPQMGYGQMLAYDSARKRVVMCGGTSFDDIWEWDGTNWTKKVPLSSPEKRSYHSAAWDNENGKMVLFGGKDAQIGVYGETWEWDGSSWLRDLPVNSPDDRDWHAMAYDSTRKKVVLFGGSDGSANALGDTWEWDGTDWMKLSPATSPSARWGHALAYNVPSGKVLLFGGMDTGGIIQDDTWEWDGSNWEKKAPATKPIPKYKHAMTYDSSRTRVVLFGGNDNEGTFHDDAVWEWHGDNWEKIIPAWDPQPPFGRFSHAISYDPARGRTVMFGGYDDFELKDYGDTWEWDGKTWFPRSPESSPPARNGHILAYDDKSGTTVMFGGSGSNGVRNDTWEWDGQGEGYAGQLLDVEVSAAGFQKDHPKTEVKKVTARFVSGGVGYPAGVRKDGVELLAWYDDKWNPVSANTSGPKEPGPVEWAVTDNIGVGKLNKGDQKYHFAVIPAAPNGFGNKSCPSGWTAAECDMGMVSTEYVEVAVRYRLQ